MLPFASGRGGGHKRVHFEVGEREGEVCHLSGRGPRLHGQAEKFHCFRANHHRSRPKLTRLSCCLSDSSLSADVSLTEFRHLVHNFRMDGPANCELVMTFLKLGGFVVRNDLRLRRCCVNQRQSQSDEIRQIVCQAEQSLIRARPRRLPPKFQFIIGRNPPRLS